MSNKKKVSLSIILLSISAVIFGSYAISGTAPGLDRVRGTAEDEAVNFAQGVIGAVKSGNPRDFVSMALNPRERGLKDCYESLRGIARAADPQWEVKKAADAEVYHVYFNTEGGGRVVMMLKQTGNEWKFAYVTQE